MALPRKSSPSGPSNANFGRFFVHWANFFALTPTIRPSRANYFAHEAQQHSDIETNNTTARPQQGSLETGITSAPKNCTKNAHFTPAKAMTVSVEARPAPAKAMTVSTPYRYQQAKATPVSGEQAAGSTGPSCNTRGRRQGQTAVPVGGEAWPGDRRAADVTNVVKSTRFKSPREDPCYKRRQSKPKKHHYQRKSRWIDDVCNNGSEIHTKNTLD